MLTDASFYENQVFSDLNFVQRDWQDYEFQQCQFVRCDFSHSDLRGCVFEDCTFTGCNLSMADCTDVSWRGVFFKDCKISGVNFSNCTPFGLSLRFDNCVLDYCVFFKVKLPRTQWRNCSLREADFTQANLTGGDFSGANLAGATFAQTNLVKADLRTAQNFAIDPESNQVKQAKFSILDLAGLLYKYQLDLE